VRWHNVLRITLFGVIGFALIAPSSRAQSPVTNDPTRHIGPVMLAPVVSITNAGWDSNVLNVSEDEHPDGDVELAVSPSVEGRLRVPFAAVEGHTDFDLYYYRDLVDQRSVDSDSSLRVSALLNRVTPYVAGSVINTRHRQNLEIDLVTERHMGTVTVGSDLQLTGKVTVGGYLSQANLKYEPNSLFRDLDLARVLNHDTKSRGLEVTYSLTPLTSIRVSAGQQRDRFHFISDRDSDTYRIAPSVEFKPFALVTGHASVGFQRRNFIHGATPSFNGTVVDADLSYVLLGRTRLNFSARRALEYSYVTVLSDYLENSTNVRVTHSIGNAWELDASAGRGRLSYRQDITAFPDETMYMWSAEIGYRLGRSRIGVRAEHRQRSADEPTIFGGYRRFRAGSTLTYFF
jgi:Putative beta-barrel porin 2